MTELDFDELDRAVNSLIKKEPTAAADAVSAMPVTATSPAVPATPATPPATPAPAPIISTSPLAARRTSGRFMDVVHPSSDMRSTQTPAQTPATPMVVPTPAPTPPVAPVSTPTPAPVPVVADAPWPSATPAAAAEPAPAPLTTPFLTDAKVDKRPLGSFSTVESPVVNAPTPTEPTSPALTTGSSLGTTFDKSAHPIEADTPMPAELQDDLLHIESDGEVAEPPVSTREADETPTGPTSITQQYKEQASDNKTSGAIFDTKSYHKPLAHPAKKKSGALWIVWILLLLIIGGGIGAAVYFYVLPMI